MGEPCPGNRYQRAKPAPAGRRLASLHSRLLKSHFQLSILACKHGRLRRPRRFFAVSAPFAFPKGRQKAQKLQKRIVQRLCLCTNATFEKPCEGLSLLLS